MLSTRTVGCTGMSSRALYHDCSVGCVPWSASCSDQSRCFRCRRVLRRCGLHPGVSRKVYRDLPAPRCLNL
eukprot:UN25051